MLAEAEAEVRLLALAGMAAVEQVLLQAQEQQEPLTQAGVAVVQAQVAQLA